MNAIIFLNWRETNSCNKGLTITCTADTEENLDFILWTIFLKTCSRWILILKFFKANILVLVGN